MTVVASSYEPQPNELYETEAWATEVLINRFPVAGARVWEPAAGNHKMADVLAAAGAEVITSDIETYNRQHHSVFDFFSDGPVPEGCGEAHKVITNPPYGRLNLLARKFAERSLARCKGMVALLLTAKFDSGRTRRHLFADNPRFVGKIVLLDRIIWFGGEGKQEGTEDHAWYIWGPEPIIRTPPQIFYADRVSR